MVVLVEGVEEGGGVAMPPARGAAPVEGGRLEAVAGGDWAALEG